MKIFIGYDPQDHDAVNVAIQSIKENTQSDPEITLLKEWEVRKTGIFKRSYRVDENGQMWDERDGKPFSTQFSFTRFAIPAMLNYSDEWVLFMDGDMMVKGDIKEVFEMADSSYSVMCVKHNHAPEAALKMNGMLQTRYARKNWSSFMLLNPSKCRDLTVYQLNTASGGWLHGMLWVEDDKVGSLPSSWNFLAGYDDPSKPVKNVHFTSGTPDMYMAMPTPWDEEWWSCLERHKRAT